MLIADPKEVISMLQDELVRWTERRHADCIWFPVSTLNVRAKILNKTDASAHQHK